jgi:hypothetical protein
VSLGERYSLLGRSSRLAGSIDSGAVAGALGGFLGGAGGKVIGMAGRAVAGALLSDGAATAARQEAASAAAGGLTTTATQDATSTITAQERLALTAAPERQALTAAPERQALTAGPERQALPAGERVLYQASPIRSFVTAEARTYYRVFSGDRNVGSFLTGAPPASADQAVTGLALPPANTADFIQEVHVPAGTRLQSSIA